MTIAIDRSKLWRVGAMAVTLLFGACALERTREPAPMRLPEPQAVPEPQVQPVEPFPVNPMVEVPGDRPLPAASGALERYDCLTGVENEHARIAFEARGGQVEGFAYYSKWRPRTCSIDVQRNDPLLKWRLTPDGATRVHTPIGVYLIRSRPDAYVFEFQNIQRTKACGMMGTISGTMTVKRAPAALTCSAAGVMDR